MGENTGHHDNSFVRTQHLKSRQVLLLLFSFGGRSYRAMRSRECGRIRQEAVITPRNRGEMGVLKARWVHPPSEGARG